MVVEREKLVKAMDEQKLNATGAVTSQSAAKLGKLIGASYVITGVLQNLE